MPTALRRFSNSDMSYDTKARKSQPQLQNGVALSTLVIEPEETDVHVDPAADTQRELPAESDED